MKQQQKGQKGKAVSNHIISTIFLLYSNIHILNLIEINCSYFIKIV